MKQLADTKAEYERGIAALTATIDGMRLGFAKQFATPKNTSKYKDVLMALDRTINVTQFKGCAIPFDTLEFGIFTYNHGCTMVAWDSVTKTFSFGTPIPRMWDRMMRPIVCSIQYSKDNYSREYGLQDFHLFNDVCPRHLGDTGQESRQELSMELINQMAELFARLNINIALSTNKLLVYAKDSGTHATLKQELKDQFDSDSMFVVVEPQGFGEKENAIQMTGNASELMILVNLMKQYHIMLAMSHGKGNGNIGIDKKERLVTDEVGELDDIPQGVTDYRDMVRTNLVAWCNNKSRIANLPTNKGEYK